MRQNRQTDFAWKSTGDLPNTDQLEISGMTCMAFQAQELLGSDHK